MRVIIRATRPLPSHLQTHAVAVRPHAPAEVIKRRELAYWQERGWTRQSNTYYGTYQTAYDSFRGMIEDRGWGNFKFYMFDPPGELRRSSHWACFAPRGEKGFLVHMAHRPADISSGIMTIERLITDAFEGRA
jgi:hypothetical protein